MYTNIVDFLSILNSLVFHMLHTRSFSSYFWYKDYIDRSLISAICYFLMTDFSPCWILDGLDIICCMHQITDIFCSNFWIAVVVEHDKWLSSGTEKSWYSFIIGVIRSKQSELYNPPCRLWHIWHPTHHGELKT